MKKTKILIKEINEGKNVKENLSIYHDRNLILSRDLAILDFSLEYYTLCEMMVEELSPYLHNVIDTIKEIQNAVKALFIEDERDKAVLCEQLNNTRNDVIRRQDALTAYIDRLVVYEYVCNRIELRFEKPEVFEMIKEETLQMEQDLLDELMRFIFQSKENAVISDNMREVLGQLPVRMTKSKFFELLSQSLTIFKGAERSTLERYLYMIRTSAMIYEPNESYDFFREIQMLLNELETVDYKRITKETFQDLQKGMEEVTMKLRDISELYMQLSTIINYLLAYTLTEGYDYQANEACKAIIRNIFPMVDKKVNQHVFHETFDEIEDSLYYLEGRLEKAYEEKMVLDAVLHQIGVNDKPLLEELSLVNKYEDLVLIQKLLSNSLYVDLEGDQPLEEEIADAAYVKHCTIQLIEELEERFKMMQKPVIRGIMASVLSKMPVFFNNAKEVEDYVSHALQSCTDVAEKAMSVSLLRSMMNMENW